MLAECPSPRKPRPTYRRRSVSLRPHTQINLLPVDLDIVHPATGELEEWKEDHPLGLTPYLGQF